MYNFNDEDLDTAYECFDEDVLKYVPHVRVEDGECCREDVECFIRTIRAIAHVCSENADAIEEMEESDLIGWLQEKDLLVATIEDDEE